MAFNSDNNYYAGCVFNTKFLILDFIDGTYLFGTLPLNLREEQVFNEGLDVVGEILLLSIIFTA